MHPFLRFCPIPVPGSVSVQAQSGGTSRTSDSKGSRPSHIPPLSDADISQAIERLPPLPSIATKILTVVGSDRGSASDLEDLVRMDPVITARLLKLVNSPFYGLPNRVSSISQAVTMIGFGGVKSLVVAASMSEILQSDLAPYGFGPNGLWKSSMVCAGMARAIGVEAGTPNDEIEVYFLAGIMRDIGLLALGPELARREISFVKPDAQGRGLTERERKAVGVDHVTVGMRLSDKWRLPPGIKACISEHHAPQSAWTTTYAKMVASVRLAERLAFTSKIGFATAHPFDIKIEPSLLTAAGLDVPRLHNLTKKLPSVIAAAEIPL